MLLGNGSQQLDKGKRVTKKIAKASLVKLNDNVCFTTAAGGARLLPLSNYHYDAQGLVRSWRMVTPEETVAWYESDASKGMTDNGESKLPPRACQFLLVRGWVYQVLRARCRIQLGYGNPIGKMAMLLCMHTGTETYVKRELIEAV